MFAIAWLGVGPNRTKHKVRCELVLSSVSPAIAKLDSSAGSIFQDDKSCKKLTKIGRAGNRTQDLSQSPCTCLMMALKCEANIIPLNHTPPKVMLHLFNPYRKYTVSFDENELRLKT